MKKELFLKAINELKKQYDFEQDLYDRGIDIIDCYPIQSICTTLQELISDGVKDEYDPIYGTWLDYFIYDLEFGKKFKAGMVGYKDGRDLDMSTPEALWDYFVSEHPEIEDKEELNND